jgi:hypothetical protein
VPKVKEPPPMNKKPSAMLHVQQGKIGFAMHASCH